MPKSNQQNLLKINKPSKIKKISKRIENKQQLKNIQNKSQEKQQIEKNDNFNSNEQKINYECIQLNCNWYMTIFNKLNYWRIYTKNQELHQINLHFPNGILQINGKKYQVEVQCNNQNLIKINIIKNTQQIRINLNNFIKQNLNSISNQTYQQILQYYSHQKLIIFSNCQCKWSQQEQPWKNLPLYNPQWKSLLLIGAKNSGKTALSQHLMNQTNACVLDCQVVNSKIPGCITLKGIGIKPQYLLIGNTTINNITNLYLDAIKTLFDIYLNKYFDRKLVIDTIGYLEGTGELLLLAIFTITQPTNIIILNDTSQHIPEQLMIKNYLQRTYLIPNYLSKLPISTTINKYYNLDAIQKTKFKLHSYAILQKSIFNIYDLISMINNRKLIKIINIQCFEIQSDGSFVSINLKNIDMKVILLGKIVKGINSSFLSVNFIGYIFQNYIYVSKDISKTQILQNIGVIGKNINFSKSFYQINEYKLVELQLQFGRINYLAAHIKALGVKGLRNNPAKKKN